MWVPYPPEARARPPPAQLSWEGELCAPAAGMTLIRDSDGVLLGWLKPRAEYMYATDYVAAAALRVNAGRPREQWLSAASLLGEEECLVHEPVHVPVYRTMNGPMPGCRPPPCWASRIDLPTSPSMCPCVGP